MKGFAVVSALCLDFDGTIRRSKSGKTFIENYEDIELIPKVEDLIWEYKNKGWVILGISNQAGVAHGFKTEEDVVKEMDVTFSLFKKNPFDVARWCYSDGKGKVFPYNYRSLSRKPHVGMLVLMEDELKNKGYIVDWDNSLFVGDRPEDEDCAFLAGIQFSHIDDFLNLNTKL